MFSNLVLLLEFGNQPGQYIKLFDKFSIYHRIHTMCTHTPYSLVYTHTLHTNAYTHNAHQCNTYSIYTIHTLPAHLYAHTLHTKCTHTYHAHLQIYILHTIKYTHSHQCIHTMYTITHTPCTLLHIHTITYAHPLLYFQYFKL